VSVQELFLALGVASYQISNTGMHLAFAAGFTAESIEITRGTINGFTVLSHLARKMGWPVLTDSQTRLWEQG
jgi:hypothetical protein